jgi:hypothetical protein
MMRIMLVGIGLTCLLALAPSATAQPFPVPAPPIDPGYGNSSPIGGNVELGGAPGVFSGPNISPGSLSAVFLCPGVGIAVNVLGGGGGYCNFNFIEQVMPGGQVGNMHTHCEWGGFSPIANTWQCWRVFPGQPDHPRLPDPDIIPDGMGVPWAITGPTLGNQWPPPDLVPGEQLLNAPPPEPHGVAPGAPPGPN